MTLEPVRARPTPLPDWLTKPAARFYGSQAARRAVRFDQGRGVVTLDRPVFSVGNLSVGGTGKTPMVSWMIERLRAAGCDPCIAMRGYKARGGISDEAVLHTDRHERLPVVARPDRVEGLIELFASERGASVDCVVLDDGFQHRRLARSLDLVLIDATRDPFEDALLPFGWLREPVEALARSTHIAITHAQAVGRERIDQINARLQSHLGREADAVVRHDWPTLTLTDPKEAPGQVRTEPVSWLRGRRVVAACAIAHPAPFLQRLSREVGGEVPALVFGDHHHFPERSIRTIIRSAKEYGANALVVTEKDWTKLRGVDRSRWPCPVVRPTLRLAFEWGEPGLAEALFAASKHAPDSGTGLL